LFNTRQSINLTKQISQQNSNRARIKKGKETGTKNTVKNNRMWIRAGAQQALHRRPQHRLVSAVLVD